MIRGLNVPIAKIPFPHGLAYVAIMSYAEAWFSYW